MSHHPTTPPALPKPLVHRLAPPAFPIQIVIIRNIRGASTAGRVGVTAGGGTSQA